MREIVVLVEIEVPKSFPVLALVLLVREEQWGVTLARKVQHLTLDLPPERQGEAVRFIPSIPDRHPSLGGLHHRCVFLPVEVKHALARTECLILASLGLPLPAEELVNLMFSQLLLGVGPRQDRFLLHQTGSVRRTQRFANVILSSRTGTHTAYRLQHRAPLTPTNFSVPAATARRTSWRRGACCPTGSTSRTRPTPRPRRSS